MRAGLLRHRVTIQQMTEGTDASGGLTKTPSTFATVYAEINPIRGRERFLAQQTESDVTHRMRIRHLAGVTPAMRILLGTRVFQISGVFDVDERNRELELMLEEQVP